MKSFKTAIIILILLLGIIFYSISSSAASIKNMKESLNRIIEKADHGDWAAAGELVVSQEEEWKRELKSFSYFVSHHEIDKIMSGYIRMREYIAKQEESEVFAEAAVVKYLLEHIEAMDKPGLRNVF